MSWADDKGEEKQNGFAEKSASLLFRVVSKEIVLFE